MRRRALGLALLVACGSRTDLDVDRDVGDASRDAATDARDGARDAPGDVVVTDAGCASDADCQDSVACTLDRCDPTLHVCTRAPRDALCDDGLFCDGDERCDVALGCVAGARGCADAIACTDDACDEGQRACTHAPDDGKCPISHACDPQLGCQARALAHDATTLYDVRLPSGQVKALGALGAQLTDVALHPSNVLYGLGFNALYTVDMTSGKATFAKSLAANSFNGMDAAPSGALYASGGAGLYSVDPNLGTLTLVGTFPNGRISSGDLAFVGARLLGTARGAGTDELVEFDLANKTSKVVGVTGFACIWGLAAYGAILYGLTCQGVILTLDVNTGKGMQVNASNVTFWGASAR